jgi:hypothetical protein
VFSELDTGPKIRGFKSSRGDVFLTAIKIRSTLCLEWEAKPEVPCENLRHVNGSLTYLRY